MSERKGYYDIETVKDGQEGPSVPIGISLPDDEERLLALHNKLVEYERRNRSRRYMGPDAPDAPRPIERYKEIVLAKLLVDGEVATRDLMAELSVEPGFDPGELEEAIRVIEDYVTTGGQANVDSTGFAA
ncbi:MAG: hypothetical protein Q7R60_00150 [bacterium]|nr:hypothetical protein [bacterium]